MERAVLLRLGAPGIDAAFIRPPFASAYRLPCYARGFGDFYAAPAREPRPT